MYRQSQVSKKILLPRTYYNNYYNLNELSISQIKQKKQLESSIDVRQQKQLIKQIQYVFQNTNDDQYGMFSKIGQSGIVGGKQQNQKIVFNRGQCFRRVKSSIVNQPKMCFNKQLKRRRISTRSKIKDSINSTPKYTSRSQDKIKFNNKQAYLISNKKPTIKQQQIKSSSLIRINVGKNYKIAQICTSINDEQLIRNSKLWERNDKFRRIYYHMPDDFKVEINDLNHNIYIDADQIKSRSRPKLKPFRTTIINSDLNNLDSQQRKLAKNSAQIENQKANQDLQTGPSSNLECRDLSFYSTSSEQQESPFSPGRNNHGIKRVIRRSQIYYKDEDDHHDQQYYRLGVNRQKFYH